MVTRSNVVLRGDHNQCPSCGQLFNSSAAFDKHRTGDFQSSRRCRDGLEMLSLGMGINRAGFWVTKLREQGGRGYGR